MGKHKNPRTAGRKGHRITVARRIRERLAAAKAPHRANDNIAAFIRPGEVAALEAEVAQAMASVLDALVIDLSDPNVTDTAKRVARMYVREVFAGRYEPQDRMTDFPNVRGLDELYALGPIEVRSACSHHLCPVEGSLWCGVIPGKRVLGISKFSRVSRHVLARPQIQEEAVVQLANVLESLIEPKGLALVLRAQHRCMTWRGVREHGTTMTSSVMRGILREGVASRAEFFNLIAGQGFTCSA